MQHGQNSREQNYEQKCGYFWIHLFNMGLGTPQQGSFKDFKD